tara:strand:- start:4959 stop:6266 length:1308 start_codon:yes stop_codon:yes gene_type:complete
VDNILRLKYCALLAFCLFAADSSYAPEMFWQKWTIDSHGNGADGVHIGDINQDGLIDVVSGWEQSGDIKLYINPGPHRVRDESAWSRTDISGGLEIKGIEDAAFADLDLDGVIDTVISSIEGNTRNLAIHWPQGGNIEKSTDWRAIVLAPDKHAGYMKARAGQIDGVGGADIVAGTRDLSGEKAGIYWFQSPVGSPWANADQWRRFFVGEIDGKTVTLVLKDMDADKLTDIVYSGRNGVGWFKNPGHEVLTENPLEATWERIVITDVGSELTFCDASGDGMEDIIITASRYTHIVARWLERLDESGRHWAAYPIDSDLLRGDNTNDKLALKGVACGFVDGDDRIDLVFTSSGHGHGVFMMSPRTVVGHDKIWDVDYITPYADSIKYDNLALVDMDRDGDLDIVTTEEGEGVFTRGEGVLWFENPLYRAEVDGQKH